MKMLCDKLIDLINENFECQTAIKNLEWSILHYGSDDFTIASQKKSDIPLIELQQESDQTQAKISSIERHINELVQQILESPLCLIPIPKSHQPFLQRLERARSILEEMEQVNPRARNQVVDLAQIEVHRALELLKLNQSRHIYDQALAWLFQAEVSEKRGDYEDAQIWTEKAFEYFSEGDEYCRLVVRLIQGNIYNTSSTGRIFEGQNAYSDALWRLEKLSMQEAERGNQLKAELYRVLKEQLQQKLGKPREWKTTRS